MHSSYFWCYTADAVMLDCHGAPRFDVQFILAYDGNPWIVNYQCILNKVDGLILLLWLLLTLLPRFMSKSSWSSGGMWVPVLSDSNMCDTRTKWERWTSARLGIWRKEQRKLKWVWLYVRTWVAFSKRAWNGWYFEYTIPVLCPSLWIWNRGSDSDARHVFVSITEEL